MVWVRIKGGCVILMFTFPHRNTGRENERMREQQTNKRIASHLTSAPILSVLISGVWSIPFYLCSLSAALVGLIIISSTKAAAAAAVLRRRPHFPNEMNILPFINESRRLIFTSLLFEARDMEEKKEKGNRRINLVLPFGLVLFCRPRR